MSLLLANMTVVKTIADQHGQAVQNQTGVFPASGKPQRQASHCCDDQLDIRSCTPHFDDTQYTYKQAWALKLGQGCVCGGGMGDCGPTFALGRILVAEGRIGVPSGAITKLALPQALLLPDIPDVINPEANDFWFPRLGRD